MSFEHHAEGCTRERYLYNTFDADVARLEIRLEVVRTRLGSSQQGVRHSNGTAPSSGAAGVDDVDDVRGAAHVTVVVAHAPAESHPAVARMRHQDGGTERAAGVERFRLAIVSSVLGGH